MGLHPRVEPGKLRIKKISYTLNKFVNVPYVDTAIPAGDPFALNQEAILLRQVVVHRVDAIVPGTVGYRLGCSDIVQTTKLGNSKRGETAG